MPINSKRLMPLTASSECDSSEGADYGKYYSASDTRRRNLNMFRSTLSKYAMPAVISATLLAPAGIALACSPSPSPSPKPCTVTHVCGTPTPTPTPSNTPVPTPSNTPVPTPSNTPVPTPSTTPVVTPAPSPVPAPSLPDTGSATSGIVGLGSMVTAGYTYIRARRRMKG